MVTITDQIANLHDWGDGRGKLFLASPHLFCGRLRDGAEDSGPLFSLFIRAGGHRLHWRVFVCVTHCCREWIHFRSTASEVVWLRAHLLTGSSSSAARLVLSIPG